VTRSIEMGRAGGIASVAGITTATFAYVGLATAGVSSLVVASTVAFDVVKYAGAAYLLFLGVRRLLGQGLEQEAEEPAPRTGRRRRTRRARYPRCGLVAQSLEVSAVRDLVAADWPAVRAIYEDGIREGNATFETDAPSWEAWDAAHPDLRLVAERDGAVVGWA